MMEDIHSAITIRENSGMANEMIMLEAMHSSISVPLRTVQNHKHFHLNKNNYHEGYNLFYLFTHGVFPSVFVHHSHGSMIHTPISLRTKKENNTLHLCLSTSSRASVLSTHSDSPPMPQTTVRTNLLQPLNIITQLSVEVLCEDL